MSARRLWQGSQAGKGSWPPSHSAAAHFCFLYLFHFLFIYLFSSLSPIAARVRVLPRLPDSPLLPPPVPYIVASLGLAKPRSFRLLSPPNPCNASSFTLAMGVLPSQLPPMLQMELSDLALIPFIISHLAPESAASSFGPG